MLYASTTLGTVEMFGDIVVFIGPDFLPYPGIFPEVRS